MQTVLRYEDLKNLVEVQDALEEVVEDFFIRQFQIVERRVLADHVGGARKIHIIYALIILAEEIPARDSASNTLPLYTNFEE